jgi:hypothetical protein
MADRYEWLARVFTELSDTLIDDFDVVEFLSVLAERTTEFVDTADVGLILVDSHGSLRVMASSTERMRAIELYELQSEEGPCHDALQTGEQVLNVDLDAADGRWPRFAPRARSDGYRVVHALPMRLRAERIGAMNIFDERVRLLGSADVSLAQAFADVATIGILQERAVHRSTDLSEELQHALNSRVAIEQAKGVVSERLGVRMEDAFAFLRAYARAEGRRLADVSADITQRRLRAEALQAGSNRPR